MVRIRPGWLPEGYALEEDTLSLLYLLREADCSVVASFSVVGATREEIVRAAEADGAAPDSGQGG